MDVREARRITGRHLLIDGPGAAAELRFDPGEDRAAALSLLRARLSEAGPEILGTTPRLVVRHHAVGASIAVRAPVDRLTAAATLLEWAAGGDATLDDARLDRQREADDRLLRLYDTGLPVFHDDEGVTIGLGARSRTYPHHALPAELPAEVGRVPVAYVTGTNGKTTTTRLLARIARAAGFVPGHTSSDGVVVDGEWLERGDWTGPGAARQVLRDRRVTFAVLETARGGLMRRGLVIDGADVAVVTNIAADHLGEWGIDDIDAMARAKLVVASGLAPGGALVVNARCAPLMRHAPPGALTFADGEVADAWADDAALHWRDGTRFAVLAEVPVTVGGAARYNVENALAAALAARALGIGDAAIREGLAALRPTLEESRGRLNRFRTAAGAEVILDFAHNPHGVGLLVDFALRLPARRRLVVLGQAGDRSDADLLELAAAVARLGPDVVVVKELTTHLRGRPLGEIPAILRRGLVRSGVLPDAIEDAPDEPTACRRVLELAGDGDQVLYLVHGKLEPALEALDGAGATALA